MEQDIKLFKADNTGDIYKDAQNIIEQTRNFAYQAVNTAMVQRNWLLGRRIADEELQGEERAEYGKEVIKKLADYLTKQYGKGFTPSNLYQFVQFYKFFPEIFHTACVKSPILSWSHYRTLLRVTDKEVRDWYLQESVHEMWSVRTLDRNIASQYYHRLLQSQNKQAEEETSPPCASAKRPAPNRRCRALFACHHPARAACAHRLHNIWNTMSQILGRLCSP